MRHLKDSWKGTGPWPLRWESSRRRCVIISTLAGQGRLWSILSLMNLVMSSMQRSIRMH